VGIFSRLQYILEAQVAKVYTLMLRHSLSVVQVVWLEALPNYCCLC